VGPNGIGKTTLLEAIAKRAAPGLVLPAGLSIGYYRQDFSGLDMDSSVHAFLDQFAKDEEELKAVASGFLIPAEFMPARIGNLSEGQKGLVSFAQLVLQRPELIILDEPTNHINFRHIPVIAAAIERFKGFVIVVSHDNEFCNQIKFHKVLDLEAVLKEDELTAAKSRLSSPARSTRKLTATG